MYNKGDRATVKKTGKVVTIDADVMGLVPPVWDTDGTGHFHEDLERVNPPNEPEAQVKKLREALFFSPFGVRKLARHVKNHLEDREVTPKAIEDALEAWAGGAE
jgi:hypothetical protein